MIDLNRYEVDWSGRKGNWSVKPNQGSAPSGLVLRVESDRDRVESMHTAAVLPNRFAVQAVVRLEHLAKDNYVDLLFLNERGDAGYVIRFNEPNGLRTMSLLKREGERMTALIDKVIPFPLFEPFACGLEFDQGFFTLRYQEEEVMSCFDDQSVKPERIGIGLNRTSFELHKLEFAAREESGELKRQVWGLPCARTKCAATETVMSMQSDRFRFDIVRCDDAAGQFFIADIFCRTADGWLPVGDSEAGIGQWAVYRGRRMSPKSYHKSANVHWVRFEDMRVIDDLSVELACRCEGYFALTVRWSIADDFPIAACVLEPERDEHFVVGVRGFGPLREDQIDEVLCGTLQHAKVIRGEESIPASELPVPAALLQQHGLYGPVTYGMFVAPASVPFEHERAKGDMFQRYGMSLRNAEGGVQPIAYMPQYGNHSRMKPGERFSFSLGFYASCIPLYDAYVQLCREVYGYRAYRNNVFDCSLTDTFHHLVQLVKEQPEQDDSVDFHPSPSGWWSRAKGFIDIENDQAIRTTATAVLLGAYYVTGDQELYERRVEPVIEFHLSRNGYGWTPKQGYTVYRDPNKFKLCSVPFDISTLSPLYRMTRRLNPAIRELALQKLQNNDDYWLKRTPMSSPLAAYRLTGDPAYLEEAVDKAHSYMEEIMAPYTHAAEPVDFYCYYSLAWTELLELYEETGDESLLNAACTEARRFVTQVYVRPVPEGTVVVPGQDQTLYVHDWWKPSALYANGSDPVPDEEVEAWIVSQSGMGFEALATFDVGFTLNPAWAPFLLRLATYANDAFMKEVAHNAVIGRYTNYPGYYYKHFGVHHMKPRFPYVGPSGVSLIYYHHIPVQLGMTLDYLVTEQISASNRQIWFPSEFEANYVSFKYRVFGHEPGRFYDERNVWLHMPEGIVSSGNPQLNWISAVSNKAFCISLVNVTDAEQQTTLTLHAGMLHIDPAVRYVVRIIRDNDKISETEMVDGTLRVAVSPKSITAAIVYGLSALQPHHRLDLPEGGSASYSLASDTPVGQVWGMLLARPDGSGYEAFIQNDSEIPAVLHYSFDEGKTYTQLKKPALPNEWTVSVRDLRQSFVYILADSLGNQSAPVRLQW